MTCILEHQENIDSEMSVNLIWRVEHFLKASEMPASRFGREALGDPCFVADLRNGREPRAATAARVRAYLDEAERDLAKVDASPPDQEARPAIFLKSSSALRS